MKINLNIDIDLTGYNKKIFLDDILIDNFNELEPYIITTKLEFEYIIIFFNNINLKIDKITYVGTCIRVYFDYNNLINNSYG